MHRPRIALYLRNAAFAVLALAWSAPFLLAIPVVLLPIRHLRPILDTYLRGIAFLLKHVCGLSWEVRGLERLRGGPVLIAAAHQTTWENLYLPILFDNPAIVEDDRTLEVTRSKSRAGQNILVYASEAPTGSQPEPPLRERVAALYETLHVPCVPVALNSSRFWQFRSWLRHPGVITVEILAPIAPGLEKRAFMDMLAARLNGATERLMHEADPPALMTVPTLAARRMAAAMHSANLAQK